MIQTSSTPEIISFISVITDKKEIPILDLMEHWDEQEVGNSKNGVFVFFRFDFDLEKPSYIGHKCIFPPQCLRLLVCRRESSEKDSTTPKETEEGFVIKFRAFAGEVTFSNFLSYDQTKLSGKGPWVSDKFTLDERYGTSEWYVSASKRVSFNYITARLVINSVEMSEKKVVWSYDSFSLVDIEFGEVPFMESEMKLLVERDKDTKALDAAEEKFNKLFPKKSHSSKDGMQMVYLMAFAVLILIIILFVFYKKKQNK